MAFLTVSDGTDTITLDIETESATESEPEAIGSTARAFDGSFRGDKEEFRVWNFVAVNLLQDDYDALRAMIQNDASLTIDGDALGEAGPVTGIVVAGAAPYVDDARDDSVGFTRTIALTVKRG